MDPEQHRVCTNCRRILGLAEFSKPRGPCNRCRERDITRNYENALRGIAAGTVPERNLRKARNTPPRILLNFVPPPDWDALNPIMNDILAMHDPYPAYNPPSATPEGLAPLVDIASYPICAGQFTMHPDYSVTLQNGEGGDEQQDNSVPLRLALENFRDADQEEAKRQIAKNIGDDGHRICRHLRYPRL